MGEEDAASDNMTNMESVATQPAAKGTKITPVVISFTALLLVSGTINTIGFKYQGYNYNFKHGMLQAFFMFIGEFFNLLTFTVPLMFSPRMRKEHFDELQEEAVTKGRNPKVSKILLGIPSLLDSVGSSLQNTALLLLPASVNQLLCGGTLITSCLVSKIMLGRSIRRHHWLGNFFALVGFTLVGYSTLINDDATARYSLGGEVLGIAMVALSLVFQGIQGNLEEWIMIKNAVEARRMVGMEGMFGMMFTFCWMVMFSFFACPEQDMCDIGGYLEDPIMGLKQVLNTPGLFFWCATTVFSVMFFNMSSMNLTKRVSCIYSAFWSATRTAVVWVVSLLLGLETFQWNIFLIELAGFAFLILGNFTYNEILEWKIFGLNKKLSKYLKADEADAINK